LAIIFLASVDQQIAFCFLKVTTPPSGDKP